MKLRHILRLLAVVGISALSSAQVDPRERYGTYLGGSNTDCFDMFLDNCPTVGHNYSPASTSSTAVMIDKSGFIYVAGMTDAVDFPTTPSAYRRTVHYADNSFGDQVSADSFLTNSRLRGPWFGLRTWDSMRKFWRSGLIRREISTWRGM
jgi:hypothetical protein